MLINLPKPIGLEFGRDLEERLALLNGRIGSIRFSQNEGRIAGLELQVIGDGANDELKAAIDSIIREVSFAASKINHVTIFETEGGPLSMLDPHPRLQEERQIVPSTPGQFVLQGDFARLQNSLDRYLLDEFEKLNCVEQLYPLLLDTKGLFEMSYFETMSHHIFFATSLQDDYEAINSFSKENSRAGNPEKRLKSVAEKAQAASHIISPTVCFHCFRSMHGTTLEGTEHAFTGTNKCLREERSAVRGLERLQTFNMREAIFLGPPNYIDQKFEQCLAFVKDFFGRKLNLKFRIRSANDPFFGTVGSAQQVFQTAMNLKFELQVYLPYADKFIACGSLNKHLNSITKAFSISCHGLPDTHSMCLGIGFERLLLAMLAQTGRPPKELEEHYF